MRTLWICAASLCWTAGLGSASAADTAPLDADQVRALIVRLGSDVFVERESAMQSLVGGGLPIRPALVEALPSDDPEVRHRLRRVLEKIDQVDLKERLAAFMADTDGARNYNLPGWDRFRAEVGDDKSCRELFVEIFKAEGGLLKAVLENPKQAPETFGLRGNELQQMLWGPYQRQPSLGSVCALLFLGSDASFKLDDQALMPVTNLVNQQAFQQAISNGPRVGQMKKLLGRWIAQRTESFATFQNLHLAMRFEMKEGLVPAVKIVQGNQDPNQLQWALLAIGRLGGKEHLADVVKLFDRTAVCASFQQNNKMITTQVRDVALAVALHIGGQKHADFGFTRLQANPQMLFNVHTLGFENDDERKGAFDKWPAVAKQLGLAP